MNKYGVRHHYDIAQQRITDGIWRILPEQGLILSSSKNWSPIGSLRDRYVRLSIPAGGKFPTIAAHRVIWEYVHGPSDLNLTINHKDGNGLNNKIDNLELVTNQDNSIHAHQTLGRGNGSRNVGEDNAQALLNPDKVRRIRQMSLAGYTLQLIADEVGVQSIVTIHAVVHGRNWSHVEGVSDEPLDPPPVKSTLCPYGHDKQDKPGSCGICARIRTWAVNNNLTFEEAIQKRPNGEKLDMKTARPPCPQCGASTRRASLVFCSRKCKQLKTGKSC